MSHLVDMFQHHLIHALKARIDATEQAIGKHFAFEIVQRDTTTAFFAHRWPHAQHHLPFHRVFDYQAPVSAATDLFLDRIVDEQIDAVIEVMPGSHHADTTALLRSYHFQPGWRIPWLYLHLKNVQPVGFSTAGIDQVDASNLASFAETLCDGYGYQEPEREAWRIFTQHGYQAPGFVCFLAMREKQAAAAGVVHLTQGSALVDGAATLTAHRGSGLQQALLATRLSHAKQQGAQYAFSRTGAGSISQGNLQKLGMRLLVESTAWRRV